MNMKKFFAFLILFACVATANAQFYAGGSFGFTSTSVKDGESGSSFKIIPNLGYQVDEDISVGLQVGFSHGLASFGSLSTTDIKSMLSNVVGYYSDINMDDMKLNGFTISPYVRYNVIKTGGLSVFLEGYFGFNSITTDDTPSFDDDDDDEPADKTKLSAFELGIRPGMAYNLAGNFDLVCKFGAFGYMSAKEKESDTTISRVGLSFDTYNLLFGFQYRF